MTMFKKTWIIDPSICHDNAIQSIKQIVHHFGVDNVFIISKCRDKMRKNTIKWLFETINICGCTDILKENVLFCNERTGKHGKDELVAKHKITHFIDDRHEVLKSILGRDDTKQCIIRNGGKLIHFVPDQNSTIISTHGLNRTKPVTIV